jgi:Zn-finger nucleic acid-binding protein
MLLILGNAGCPFHDELPSRRRFDAVELDYGRMGGPTTGVVPMKCPGCLQQMDALPLEGTYRGPMTIDVCTACRGFWFDAGEQFRLTPATTLALVRRVGTSREVPRQRMRTRLPCPRCNLALSLTYDLVRDDKYRFYRCPSQHGVFMPFFEFLRSQDLVRGLTPQEVDGLKKKLVSITCSSCGAPIDLQTQTRCDSCGSGLAIVDLDHLGDALRQLDADARSAAPPGGAPPPIPPDEIIADWRADQEARRRLEEGDDDREMERQVDLLDVGVTLLSRLLGT